MLKTEFTACGKQVSEVLVNGRLLKTHCVGTPDHVGNCVDVWGNRRDNQKLQAIS